MANEPVTHSDIVEAMKTPDFYDHPVDAIEYLQTHISSVLLTGEKAYKLKKPVDFGFLDFSTLERRKHFCEEEVSLNQRLAPDVYLGVRPVTRTEDGRLALDASGETVDWLVEMRQLDRDRLGTGLLARGELAPDHIDAVVEQLVPFYRQAATGPGIDELGTADAVKINTDENFEQTAPFVGGTMSRDLYDGIREFTDGFLAEQRDLFDERVREGRIRESHGDLHLGNIFFLAEPVIFDCIEFNRRFRCGDVGVDLAFLAMDLDFHGRPELSERLVARYIAASGDRGVAEVMDFYRCYRAYVRGKIACFSMSDPSLEPEQRRCHLELARRYFGLAARYAGRAPASPVVVVFGLMGTGKTTLAEHLASSRGWQLVSTDSVRKELAGIGESTRVYVPYGDGLYSSEMSRRTYAEVARRVEILLAAGFPVVVDGCYGNEEQRETVEEAVRRTSSQAVFVQTACSRDEQMRRLDVRQESETRSDGRSELVDAQRRDFEPVARPHEVVRTDDGVAAAFRRLRERLAAVGVGEAG